MNASYAPEPPDHQYLDLLKDVHFQPIFILGPHRSGTTILYKMLAATGSFNSVTAYHVLRYDEILRNHIHHIEDYTKQQLNDLFTAQGVTNRGLDHMEVTPDSPEEYSFVLFQASSRLHLNPNNLPHFVELCKKIQFVSTPDRPLLLKNPLDSQNFMYIRSMFPDARFIFIHRHPINVINSQLTAVRSALDTKNPYLALLFRRYNKLFERSVLLGAARLLFSSRPHIGVRLMARFTRRVTAYFLQHVNYLPDTHYISIRYEDLCKAPETVTTQILRFLGYEHRTDLDYTTFIQPRPVRLLDEVRRRQTVITNKMEAYLAFHGYA